MLEFSIPSKNSLESKKNSPRTQCYLRWRTTLYSIKKVVGRTQFEENRIRGDPAEKVFFLLYITSGLFHYATHSSRSPQFVVLILINSYLTKAFHYAAAPRSPERLPPFSSRGCAARSPFPCARMGHSIIPRHSILVPSSYAF